ncbi:MAG: geranylgeranyl diphosphate synthase, type [Pyrinomonadaceae bacterium]|jgi:geranylgeranyl pyrophosphate synthase|nr:geranylgeranyl diphosphate synthase, type [Pyrinomonadaceae bacterium]
MKTSFEMQGSARVVPLPDFLARARTLVDTQLDLLLPAESVSPTNIHAAIRWSVFAGGKRFRPALLLAIGETFGAPRDSLMATACALEMIHTYSLVHDDLPSMDDDDLRRGRPTCHVRFGEPSAILAGDALLTLAFKTIAEDEKLTATKRVGLISEIARAAGTPDGMVAGQAYDLEAEARNVAAEELEKIHRLKTGALITAAGRCGAIIADASAAALAAVTDYAGQLGLLFQITDDLLDVTATAEAIGKTPGKDARSRKATYPALHGIEATRKYLASTHAAACEPLSRIDRPTDLLRAIADFILEREA